MAGALSLSGLVTVVLDVSGSPAGAGVSGDDLERTGVVPAPGQIAVIKTLWTDRAWGRPEFWDDTIHLEPSVSEWTTARGVTAVAMDCFPEKPFWRMTLLPAERGANHKRWLKAGIPIIQLLTNLGGIGGRFKLVALPLRLRGMAWRARPRGGRRGLTGSVAPSCSEGVFSCQARIGFENVSPALVIAPTCGAPKCAGKSSALCSAQCSSTRRRVPRASSGSSQKREFQCGA